MSGDLSVRGEDFNNKKGIDAPRFWQEDCLDKRVDYSSKTVSVHRKCPGDKPQLGGNVEGTFDNAV